MAHLALLVICLGSGVLLRQLKAVPRDLARSLNVIVIYLAYPALLFVQIPKLLGSGASADGFAFAAAMPWLQFIGVAVLFSALGKALRWPRPVIGALILTTGLANTSFVGFPLLEALMGPDAIPTAIVVDQLGSFLVLATLGLLVASAYSGRKLSAYDMVKRIAVFPPFLALVTAAILQALRPDLLKYAAAPLEPLSGTLVPLALVSVGFQLSFAKASLRRRGAPLALGLVVKLLLAPAIFSFVYTAAFGPRNFAAKVTLLESAMAPMITGAIVAADFQLDEELANLLVGIGIPLSLLTVALWNRML